MFKNVASQKILVFAFDETDNTPVTGDASNITCKIIKDYGSAVSLTDTSATELESGYYEFDISQTESNADVINVIPVSSTSDVQVIGVPATIFTVPQYFPDLGIESDGDLAKVNTLNGHTAQTGDSYARIGANGAGLTDLATASALSTHDTKIEGRTISSSAADNLEASALTMVRGTAQSGTLSSTEMTTNLTEATTDHYKNRYVMWTSGVLDGSFATISAYTSTGGKLTYDTTKTGESPSAGDTFIIV